MRSKGRGLLVALVAVLVVSAAASASASAFNLQWNVNGAKLEAGETREVTGKGSAYTFVLFGHKLTCGASEGAETIVGGKPGTGKATLVFQKCSTEEVGCEVKSSGGTLGTIEFTGLPITLKEDSGPSGEKLIVENIESKRPGTTKEWGELEFEARAGGSCSEYPSAKVKGSYAGKLINLAGGSVELNFPTEVLKTEPELEYFGVRMTFTGKSTWKLVGEGALTVS
jgi:hypothetical protein